MRIRLSASDIDDSWMKPIVARLFSEVDWKTSEYGRGWLQAILDNDLPATGIRAYSPVLTEAQINAEVPTAWPGSTFTPIVTPAQVVDPVINEETGEVLEEGYTIPAVYGEERLKKYREYTQAYEVEGGYVLRFTSAPAQHTRDTEGVYDEGLTDFRDCDTQQFSVWVNKTGGFLTEAEVQAIRIVESPE